MRIDPYLNFDGQCREAFEHYARVLGGRIEAMMDFAGTPEACGGEMPVAGERIVHACLRVGDAVLMGSDVPPGYPCSPGSHYVSIQVEDAAEAARIFAELSDGATVQMAFSATFWSPGFGMLLDRFGTPWMVNTVPPETGCGEPG